MEQFQNNISYHTIQYCPVFIDKYKVCIIVSIRMRQKNDKNLQDKLSVLDTVLGSFDVSPQSRLLYLTSLNLGPSSIPDLADTLKIARPNVYKLISELERVGLSDYLSRRPRPKLYMVESPARVKEIFDKHTTRLNEMNHRYTSLLPELLAAYSQGAGATRIRLYNNRTQWMELFYRTLDESGDQMEWFGNYETWLQFMPLKEEQSWIKERVERKISIRLLLLDNDSSRAIVGSFPELKRECKIFTSPQSLDCSFQLYSNKAVIWQPHTPLVILVEDEYVVKMLKVIFDLLWSNV